MRSLTYDEHGVQLSSVNLSTTFRFRTQLGVAWKRPERFPYKGRDGRYRIGEWEDGGYNDKETGAADGDGTSTDGPPDSAAAQAGYKPLTQWLHTNLPELAKVDLTFHESQLRDA